MTANGCRERHFLLPVMANCMTIRLLVLALYAASASAYASALQLPLNVDCGASDQKVGFMNMSWDGDDRYIRSGLNGVVKDRRDDGRLIKPLITLRYFPKIRKNCYSIPGVGQGKRILVRAWFYYGNYDGLKRLPKFDVLFNGNPWGSVSFVRQNRSTRFEVVHLTKVDDVSVCLVRTNPTDVPFINSLEIKPLDYNVYMGMDPNFPLYLKGRYAYGLNLTYIRHPEDSYDRVWMGFHNYVGSNLTEIYGSAEPDIEDLLAPDKPPVAAMRQAIMTSSSETLTVPTLIESDNPVPHYVNLYFSEVSDNDGRSLDIFLDGHRFWPETINVPKGIVKEISIHRVSMSVNSTLTLQRGNGSTQAPLINAAEFFLIGEDWRDHTTQASDVKALSQLQQSYVQLNNWSGDPCLPTGYGWEWVGCNNESEPQVTALNLSGYELTGDLVDFSGLAFLQTIDLHNNSLSGSIPEFLGKFPNLTHLNLADNIFSGSVPESLTNNLKIKLNTTGNNISQNKTNNTGDKNTNTGVVAGLIISVVFLLLLIVLIIFKKRSSAKRASTLLESEIKHDFSYAEILEVTNNFEKILGKGGSGYVYYGRLRNGSEVAVKVLQNSLSQGTKEFVSEAKLLLTVHHRCLVSFVGYCEEGGKLILLYEYMSGGDLRQLLSGKSGESAFLTWETRLQIALRVATGLHYLHSGCYPPIIHRDVKTTNILLNEKMKAKLADFGLSKVGKKEDVNQIPTAGTISAKYTNMEEFAYSLCDQKGDVTQLSTVVAGTPGYIDPEYFSSSMVTKMSDVYSFGVVLFELITGYPPIFNVAGERFHVVQWVTPRIAKGDIHGVADFKLRGRYNVNSLWKVAEIAMRCTTQPSHSRPNMSTVIDQLKEAIEEENNSCQYKSPDTPFTEVQLTSSSSYEASTSFPSGSHAPPAR